MVDWYFVQRYYTEPGFRGKKLEKNQKWFDNHREYRLQQMREYSKEWYEKNKEKKLQQMRKYYKKKREEKNNVK